MSQSSNDEEFHDHSLKNPIRIINLTDGVFAIIMTLLVLELKVPDLSNAAMTNQQLIDCGYKMLLYFASFFLAGVYWMSHRFMFHHVKRVNNYLVWKNIMFLMICSLIPFAAAVLGSYPHSPAALVVYGILLTALAGWRLLMYVYICRHESLLYSPVPKAKRTRVTRVMIFAPIMFILSLCLIPVSPAATLVFQCITPPIFVLAITFANRGTD